MKKVKCAKVALRIPKRWKGDDERFIACNGKRVLVKTGVDVTLDADLAEVYFNSCAQRDESERRIAEMASAV